MTHETSRFTATKSRYYIQAAEKADELNPDYLVVTSPSYIYENERTTHEAQLAALKDAGITALMYQDRVGDGVVPHQNNSGVYWTFDDTDTIDNHLYGYLDAIRDLHDPTAPEMWINMESWRKHCTIPISFPNLCRVWNVQTQKYDYKYSKSYPALAENFKKQIQIARQFGPVGTYDISSVFQLPDADYKFTNNQRTLPHSLDDPPSPDGYRDRAVKLTEIFQ